MKQVMSSLVVQTNNYTCNERRKGTAESWDKSKEGRDYTFTVRFRKRHTQGECCFI